MLKALELIGFKSFADKTRFEFPAGITVIVGPNGSGKSNIVDAIKWVLGEQSAKSLRGKDMADVIFKGAGGGGRRVVNTAEATLVFDNAERRLAIDAPEVHVTRRVYRSGEGEYFINRQPCRLRDVRDLFRGTGVGPDAYSLIEQGKVESLLHSSARERRAMFEEAAGISRFKAKKIEAQRRLERVEQNLLRLSDIVQEVETRLRRVRSQAAKARRYRQHSERLQQLRIQVGLCDWRRLTGKLTARQAEIEKVRSRADGVSDRAEALESRANELEAAIGAGGDRIRQAESELARIREEIATRQSAIEHERARCRDLEQEAQHPRRRLLAMSRREGDLLERWRETAGAVEQAAADRDQTRDRLRRLEEELDERTGQLARIRTENEGRRNRYVERMRELAALGNQVSQLQSQQAALEGTRDQLRRRLDELEQAGQSLVGQLERMGGVEARLEAQREGGGRRLEQLRLELAESRRLLIRRQEDLAERQGRLTGLVERLTVLEELEKSLEGVGAGARELIDRAGRETAGPFGEVRGLVAELIEAPIEFAPMIDIALGPAAQYVVVSGDVLLRRIQSGEYRPAARVGLLLASARGLRAAAAPSVDWEGRPGVMGRADRVIRMADDAAPAIGALLDRTWLVERLEDALALRAASRGPVRFVTRSGELLESDGVLLLGPPGADAGLVSRRSQLRALQPQIAAAREQIGAAEAEILQLRENLEQQELAVRRATDERDRLSAELAEHRLRVGTLQARREQVDQQRRATESQWQEAAAQSETTSRQCEEAREQLASQEASVAEVERAIRREDEKVRRLEAAADRVGRQATGAKVEAAKSEQRLESLQARLAELAERKDERARAIAEARDQLAQIVHRLRQAERAILRDSSASAELHLQKEDLEREIDRQIRVRRQSTEQRREVMGRLQALRREYREIQEELHERELAAGEIRHQRTALADRLREDYGVNLETYEAESSQEGQEQREAIDEEIAALRRKLNNIGPVNMDALDELDALEARFNSLSSQQRDLTEAKQSLEHIIQKMNADSRRMFVETLDAIRANFQSLYRRSFGGGRADIILEEGVDVLEAGIEIVANPPGKPSFHNSLLSGGEKALTAVALLLAVFQYRPSPFCVLDEVDAPFDEANIGRFIDVLRSFLGWTRFVMVTHSKKTMTAATTLYGVTMQESGVSKQVSVRFEDVSEDGRIRQEAVDRQLAKEKKAADDERGAA